MVSSTPAMLAKAWGPWVARKWVKGHQKEHWTCTQGERREEEEEGEAAAAAAAEEEEEEEEEEEDASTPPSSLAPPHHFIAPPFAGHRAHWRWA
jgi:hypothetical protein